MKKSRGILILLVMALLLGGLSYVAVQGVGAEKTGSASSIKLGLDLAGGVSITYRVVGEEKPDSEDMNDTIYKLQRRVEGYSTEAVVYQEGNDRINIEIPGVNDANIILEELGKPGSLYFIAQKDKDGNLNYSSSSSVNADGTYSNVYTLNKTLEELEADGSIVLVGNDVSDAQGGYRTDEMQNQEAVVQLELTAEGAKKFAAATEKAYQGGETIAIYYDYSENESENFISVPKVNAVINTGSAEINGMADLEEARRIASTIRIGGLKLELEELHSKVVGAQLGSDAIRTSLIAAAVGLAVVVIFMIAVYFLPGLAAGIALCLYTVLIVILLDGFDMTLTLPGVAGIILSVGMAVDANVIIFARIREELATGKTVKSAVKIGFDKALSAIIDGNVTTLIAAFVLWFKGTGSVKGFAQTLVLGIVLSMFTALFVTRLLLNAFYAIGFTDVKWYGVGKEKKTKDFLSKKAVFFAVSLVVIAVGFVFMGVHKMQGGNTLNYSLEFIGGASTNVTFKEDMSIEALDSEVVPLLEQITGDGNVQSQKVQGTNEVIFKTRTLTVEEREQMANMLTDRFGVDENTIVVENISSTISNEMKKDTIIAVVIAVVLMLIYIRIRFSDIRFGISSVAALLHDVLVVLAFYAVARVSVGSTFIACLLTIVGYSINATIVIFDRIRENMAAGAKKTDLKELVNRSISQTLSRSIFTSLTTFIMVAALYVFGVTSIREFALPLMVGIVCGTYSSICLTGAMWYLLRNKFAPKVKAQ